MVATAVDDSAFPLVFTSLNGAIWFLASYKTCPWFIVIPARFYNHPTINKYSGIDTQYMHSRLRKRYLFQSRN